MAKSTVATMKAASQAPSKVSRARKAIKPSTTDKLTNVSTNSEETETTIVVATNASKKRKSSSDDDATLVEKTKKRSKTTPAPKAAPVAMANTKAKRAAASKVVPATVDAKRSTVKRKAVDEEDDETAVIKKAKTTPTTKMEKTKSAATLKKASTSTKSEIKKEPVKKKVAAPKATKRLPVINTRPTQLLHTFVFGEGSQGELGLGAKNEGKKTVIDVQRPRLNPFLEKLNVVQLAVGGMHVAALTADNKIYTWGVNDQGALGRPTTQEGKLKDADADDSDSDSESESENSGLNPSEAEPRQVDPACFPEGTEFASLFAGDSTTFAVTTTGLVYGWGTFRGNDGVLGFNKESMSKDGRKTQGIPTLIPELKQVTKMAIGTNHALALTQKGKAFVWGAGEQSQLGRRVVARTAAGALVPREFGFQRKTIVDIATGDYFSYAVEANGTIYAWGHNGYGQTGIPVTQNQDDIIPVPTVVESLKGRDIHQLAGGNHHTIACTKSGEVLVWGRLDNAEGGIKTENMPDDAVIRDESTGRILATKTPLILPNLKAKLVATGTDTCFVVTKDGQAYSWGFSTNYQTGQGTHQDVIEATLVNNSAVRGKNLTFAGVGGQFGVLACEKDVTATN